MTTHSDDHPRRDSGPDYEHNIRRARIAGYVLLAGLLLEVVCDIIWFHGVQSLISIICVALIAGGVSGEIVFENQARLAARGSPTVPAPTISRVQQAEPDYRRAA